MDTEGMCVYDFYALLLGIFMLRVNKIIFS